MTRSELLEVVYRFYPRGLHTYGVGYDKTEERRRQRDAARRGFAALPTWNAMIHRLGARYPILDHQSHDLSDYWDPAYQASIEIPGRKLGFHVSLLGPYYGIHRTGLPVEELPALDLAREIEATYPGYEPIPPELGDEVMPDVAMALATFGYATIYDLLLSTEWEWSSTPWPPPPYVPRTAAEREAFRARLERPPSERREWRLVAVRPRQYKAGELPDDDQPDDEQEHDAGEQPDDLDRGAGGPGRRPGPRGG